MATLKSLRTRSEALFTNLAAESVAAVKTRTPGHSAAPRTRAATNQKPTFSWFRTQDAVGAAALAWQLSALSASKQSEVGGLEAALDAADEHRSEQSGELIRQGLALFVTHNNSGRQLIKPRTVIAAPGLFQPTPRPRRNVHRVSVGGAAQQLDYWREDALANEHHQHWHEVYPWTGLPPANVADWVASTPRVTQIAILNAVQPADWDSRLRNATTPQIAGLFAQVLGPQTRGSVMGLSAPLYRALFRLNDRQGELFGYMHQQMLARYDAELLSNGLPRVAAFGPAKWTGPIPEGHTPTGLAGFGVRAVNQRLSAGDVTDLRSLQQTIDRLLTNPGALKNRAGKKLAVTPTIIGEALEATVTQLRDFDGFDGLHNSGHGAISSLSSTPDRPNVMASTVGAIRDQVFWRWHKHIDDLNATWQNTLSPYTFTDTPNVVVRNDLTAANTTPWTSPDIALLRMSDLPANTNPQTIVDQLLGGTNWTTDPAAASVTVANKTIRPVAELTTRMATVNLANGQRVTHLTHDPYGYALRVENRATRPVDVTLRVFLVPATNDSDRRAWIEMDKWIATLPAKSKNVLWRPDQEAAVIKRPIDTSPATATAGNGGPDDNAYCDCGWPYTLLLPRGTTAGMAYRLAVFVTDATIDRVAVAQHCGSMSFCGAVDRYPDTRDMGYPFSRPFGPNPTGVQDRLVTLKSAGARTITIRHV
jgi:hypothetical protein